MSDTLWESIAGLYDADLKQRLQYCWDDLDLLERALGGIQARIRTRNERPSDVEQMAQIENLVYSISRRVEELMLTRQLNRPG